MSAIGTNALLPEYRFRGPLSAILFWVLAGPLNPGLLLLSSGFIDTFFRGDLLEFYVLPSSICAALIASKLWRRDKFTRGDATEAVLWSFLLVVALSPFIVGLPYIFENGLSLYLQTVFALYFFGFLFLAIPYTALTLGLMSVFFMVIALIICVRRV